MRKGKRIVSFAGPNGQDIEVELLPSASETLNRVNGKVENIVLAEAAENLIEVGLDGEVDSSAYKMVEGLFKLITKGQKVLSGDVMNEHLEWMAISFSCSLVLSIAQSGEMGVESIERLSDLLKSGEEEKAMEIISDLSQSAFKSFMKQASRN